MTNSAKLFIGDNRESLRKLPDQSVQVVVTSPPYWGLRDYGMDGQIGLEQSPSDFVEELCTVFDEVWRVLKDDGTVWLNIGDSYASMRDSKVVPDSLRKGEGTRVSAGAANRNPKVLKEAGLKHKDLAGIPWRVAFALQARGWHLRSDIIWSKPNPMPESVTDRPTKSHEHIFLLTKFPKYYYDHEAIKEPSVTGDGTFKNKRDVWSVQTKAYKGAHFAVYPTELVEPCVLAGSREGDVVLDPFSGSGTTGVVALENKRDYIGLELNPEYAKLSVERIKEATGVDVETE
jgi:site-specific DNA-methyltransferase (cytosine-N4-specific)